MQQRGHVKDQQSKCFRRTGAAALAGAILAFATIPGRATPKEPNVPRLDPAKVLFPVKDTIPGHRIGWYINNSYDAYVAGLKQNKPVVLVFSEYTCSWCSLMIANALTCPDVNKLAGHAIFALSEPARDRGAAAIGKSLNVKSYPTVSILAPNPNMIQEKSRMVGYYTNHQLSALLGKRLVGPNWDVPENPPFPDRRYDRIPLSRVAISFQKCWAPGAQIQRGAGGDAH